MSAPKRRAEDGVRQEQALKAIAEFEAQAADWDYSSLARVLGISPQQCRTVVATLAVKGALVIGNRTLVKRGLMIAPPTESSSTSAAA